MHGMCSICVWCALTGIHVNLCYLYVMGMAFFSGSIPFTYTTIHKEIRPTYVFSGSLVLWNCGLTSLFSRTHLICLFTRLVHSIISKSKFKAFFSSYLRFTEHSGVGKWQELVV